MINQYSEIHEEVEEEKEEKTPLVPMLKLSFSIIGVIICAAILLGGLFTFIFSLKVLTYKPVEAVASKEFTTEKDEYSFSYKIGEEEFLERLETKKRFREGDKTKVYYNPSNKEDIRLDKLPNFIAIVVAIVGGYLLKFVIPFIPKYRKEVKVYYKEFEDEDEE